MCVFSSFVRKSIGIGQKAWHIDFGTDIFTFIGLGFGTRYGLCDRYVWPNRVIRERNLPFVKFILSTFMAFEWNALIPNAHTLEFELEWVFACSHCLYRPPLTCDERSNKTANTEKYHRRRPRPPPPRPTTTMATTNAKMKRDFWVFCFSMQKPGMFGRPLGCTLAFACQPFFICFVRNGWNGIVLLVMFYNDVRQLMNFT